MGDKTSLTERVARGSVWVLSANVFSLLLKIFIIAVLARLLDPDEFGLVAIAASFSSLVMLFGDAGLTMALVQRKDLSSVHIATAFSISIALSLTLFVLTLIVAPGLQAFFRMEGLGAVLRVIAVSLVLQGLAVVPKALLMRASKFRTLALLDFGSYALGYGALSCLLAWLGWGVWALVAGLIGQALIATVVAFCAAPHALVPRFSRNALRDLFSMSMWFYATSWINFIALEADNIIVGRSLGAEALGFYNRSYQLMTIPAKALGRAARQVVFPTLAKVQGDYSKMRSAFLRSTRLIAIVGIPASVLVPLYAFEIVELLLGSKWLPVVPLLGILGAGTYFRLGYRIPNAILQANGRVPLSFQIQVVYALSVVGGCLLGIQAGLQGVAVAVVVAVVIAYVHTNICAARMVGASLREFATALAPGSALGVALMPLNWLAADLVRPFGAPLLTALAGAVGCALAIGFCLTIKPLRRSLLTLP